MVGKKEERVARRRRDVTSDARRFLSRIGRRLRYSLSLSLRLEGFFLLEIGRSCSKRGLKNIHRPKIVDWCVRAPSTSSSRCASTRREKIRFFFVLLSSRGKVGKQFLPRNNKLSCFRLYVSIKILFFFFFLQILPTLEGLLVSRSSFDRRDRRIFPTLEEFRTALKGFSTSF